MNGTRGHRTISSSHATMLCLLFYGWKKKSDVKYAAFQTQSSFFPPVSYTKIQFEPCFFKLLFLFELYRRSFANDVFHFFELSVHRCTRIDAENNYIGTILVVEPNFEIFYDLRRADDY